MNILDTKQKYRQRKQSDIQHAIVHRISIDGKLPQDTTPQDLVTFFKDPTLNLGSVMPYTFLVGWDGTITRCAKLTDMTPHGWKRNRDSVGIAFIGDFRKFHITPTQFTAGAKLLASLHRHGIIKSILRHDEAPSGSKDPNKICPGKFLDMTALRQAVSNWPLDVYDLDVLGGK